MKINYLHAKWVFALKERGPKESLEPFAGVSLPTRKAQGKSLFPGKGIREGVKIWLH